MQSLFLGCRVCFWGAESISGVFSVFLGCRFCFWGVEPVSGVSGPGTLSVLLFSLRGILSQKLSHRILPFGFDRLGYFCPGQNFAKKFVFLELCPSLGFSYL